MELKKKLMIFCSFFRKKVVKVVKILKSINIVSFTNIIWNFMKTMYTMWLYNNVLMLKSHYPFKAIHSNGANSRIDTFQKCIEVIHSHCRENSKCIYPMVMFISKTCGLVICTTFIISVENNIHTYIRP